MRKIIHACAAALAALSAALENKGKEMGMEIMIKHEDIFNSMHRI